MTKNLENFPSNLLDLLHLGFYGVMVSTQDSESCDPSSNLGRTWLFCGLADILAAIKQSKFSRESAIENSFLA